MQHRAPQHPPARNSEFERPKPTPIRNQIAAIWDSMWVIAKWIGLRLADLSRLLR